MIKVLTAIVFSLLPFTALACGLGEATFTWRSAPFILVLEAGIAGVTWLGWMTARKRYPVVDVTKRRRWFYFFAILATLLSLALGLIGTFVMPEFARVFESFGSALPAVTFMAFQNRNFLWIATGVVAWLWFKFHRSLRVTPFAVMCATVLGVFVWVAWAMYLPIFKLC